jgi:hypothetical protein
MVILTIHHTTSWAGMISPFEVTAVTKFLAVLNRKKIHLPCEE